MQSRQKKLTEKTDRDYQKRRTRREQYFRSQRRATFKREVHITSTAIEKPNRLKIEQSSFEWAVRSSGSLVEV